MAYVGHYRMTAGGGLGTDLPHPEEWSCTLNFKLGGGGLAQANVDLAWSSWETLITDGLFTTAVYLDYVKVSEIDTSGHVVGTVLRHDETAHGGSTSQPQPFQICVVASLRTGERGPSKRGRIYLPGPNQDTSLANGLMSEADRDTWQSAVADFLTELNTDMGAGRELVVASQRGYNTVVTGVNVGRTMDTQRRRRRSLDESYDTPTPI